MLVRGEQLPPMPDDAAHSHLVPEFARYKEGAETLAKTNDEAEANRAIPDIKASNDEFARLYKALDGAQGSD